MPSRLLLILTFILGVLLAAPMAALVLMTGGVGTLFVDRDSGYARLVVGVPLAAAVGALLMLSVLWIGLRKRGSRGPARRRDRSS